MIGIFRFIVGLPVIVTIGSFGLNFLLAVILSLTYSQLSKESVIATITFDKILEDKHIAHLYNDKGSKINDYIIYGDQWRIDASFVKMKYWANVFGAESKYSLDRFEGRYSDINKENRNTHKAYQLEDHELVMDLTDWLTDTSYGTSTYKKIKVNTKYIVIRTQTGIMVREKELNKKEESFLEKAKSLFGF